ncbi:MAG: hypothetical protein HKN21_04950 [Candidatus Eisenbacteria bacterium]|uniref:Nuclear transport factor 2 family protein n=1 Tax=Eiseniibacteriota bacterium TaxID=2212470 RepID=A0A7Y2E7Z6_UNCEI|nr:hypothetical protein [Candidatus Eisenbacteria bacterium]
MKQTILTLATIAVVALGCSKSDTEQSDDKTPETTPPAQSSGTTSEPPAKASSGEWSSSPSKVVEGLMHAYETRDEVLYASLLADDFRYYFEPPGAKPDDILGWGKEEDLVATGNLFRTQDVERLVLALSASTPVKAPSGKEAGWMMIPVSGGELRVEVKDKEPMQVALNRQEIYVRQQGPGWQVIEWRDYPEPDGDSN